MSKVGGIANGGPLIISGGLIGGNIANDGNVVMYSGGGIFSRDPGWLVMTQTQVLSNVGVHGGGGLVNQYAVAHPHRCHAGWQCRHERIGQRH